MTRRAPVALATPAELRELVDDWRRRARMLDVPVAIAVRQCAAELEDLVAEAEGVED